MFKEVIIGVLTLLAKILATVFGLFSSIFFLGVLFGMVCKSKIEGKSHEEKLQS